MSIGTTVVTLSDLERRVLSWTRMRMEEVITTNAPYELCYVDYRDQLTDEQVRDYIAGDYESLDESLDEWVYDQQRDGAIQILEESLREIQKHDGDALVRYLIANHVIKQYSDEENEAVKILMGLDTLDVDTTDELRMLVEENDESDVIKGLVRNTDSKLFRTTIIDGKSGWSQESGTITESIEEVAVKLVELCRGTLTAIGAVELARELVPRWDALHDGIDLDVIWYGDVETAAQGNQHGLEFVRPWLLMIDRFRGAGETVRTGVDVHLFTTPGDTTVLDAKAAGYNWRTIAGTVESTYAPELVTPIKEEA